MAVATAIENRLDVAARNRASRVLACLALDELRRRVEGFPHVAALGESARVARVANQQHVARLDLLNVVGDEAVRDPARPVAGLFRVLAVDGYPVPGAGVAEILVAVAGEIDEQAVLLCGELANLLDCSQDFTFCGFTVRTYSG